MEEEVHRVNGNDDDERVILDFSFADAERLKNRIFESFFNGNSSRIKPGFVTQQIDDDMFGRNDNDIFDAELCK